MAENSLRTQKTQRPGQKREQRNKFKDVKYILKKGLDKQCNDIPKDFFLDQSVSMVS